MENRNKELFQKRERPSCMDDLYHLSVDLRWLSILFLGQPHYQDGAPPVYRPQVHFHQELPSPVKVYLVTDYLENGHLIPSDKSQHHALDVHRLLYRPLEPALSLSNNLIMFLWQNLWNHLEYPPWQSRISFPFPRRLRGKGKLTNGTSPTKLNENG